MIKMIVYYTKILMYYISKLFHISRNKFKSVSDNSYQISILLLK